MSDNKQTIWAYLDGHLPPDEQHAFEQKLEKDPGLKRKVAEAKVLDRTLAGQETEQPSLRFTANVMDRLPDLYKPITIQPLLSKRTLRWAGALLATTLTINIGLLWTLPAGSTTQIPLVGEIQQALHALPEGWLLPLSALSVGYVAYAALDAFLERRLLKQTNKA